MGPFITCGTLCNHCEIGLGALLHSDEMNEVSDEPSSFNELTENPSLTGFHDVIDENMQLPLTYIYIYMIIQGARTGFPGELFKDMLISVIISYLTASTSVISNAYAFASIQRKSKKENPGEYAVVQMHSAILCSHWKQRYKLCLGIECPPNYIIAQVEKDLEQSVCCAMIWFTERERFTKKKILIAVVSVESSYTAS